MILWVLRNPPHSTDGWNMLKHVETLEIIWNNGIINHLSTIYQPSINHLSTIYQPSINHLSTIYHLVQDFGTIHSMLCHETKTKSRRFFELTKEGPSVRKRPGWYFLGLRQVKSQESFVGKNPAKHWISRCLLPAKVQYTQLNDLEKTNAISSRTSFWGMIIIVLFS